MKAALVARQVGTAAAFVPVASALPGSSLFLYPLAAREHGDVPHTAIDDDCVIAELDRAGKLSVLVTGTSEKAAADAAQWRWARRRRIPTLAYLDQGINLELRFAEDWPDAVATISEKDSARVRSLAPGSVAVHTTGSPAVEAFAAEVERLRESGIAAEPGRIAFATEPITGMSPDAYRRINGFTDEDAFAMAKRAVAAHRGAKLVVRLHPRDSVARWPGAEFDQYARSTESAARAQVICGTRSLFLAQAAAAGVPVVSLQPGRRTESPIDLPTAETDDQALAALRRALSGGSQPGDGHRGASRRLVEVISKVRCRESR